MTRIIRLVLPVCVLLAGASPALAARGFEDGLDAGYDVSLLLNTNPPLPMIRQKRGHFKLTLMPASFKGKASERSTSAADGWSTAYEADFKGSGGGVNLSYGLSERFGLFALFLGSSIRGDFEHCQTDVSPPGPSCGIYHSFTTGVDASYQTFGLGLNFTFAPPEGSSRRTAFGLYFAPTATRMSFKQAYRKTTQLASQSQPQTDADYDMSLDKTYPGFVLGAQVGTDLNKWLRLNPFMSIGFIFPGECTRYKATAVRTQPAIRDTVDFSCYSGSKPTAADAYQIDLGTLTPFGGLGMNAEIRPLGLSINVTAPLLKDVNKNLLSRSGAEITMLSVSWSFGRYLK